SPCFSGWNRDISLRFAAWGKDEPSDGDYPKQRLNVRSTLNGMRSMTLNGTRSAWHSTQTFFALAMILFKLKEMGHEKDVQRLLNRLEEKLKPKAEELAD
ncbi:MAG: hypothetical protein EA390_00235, partial [Balneolaceae bacterium]